MIDASFRPYQSSDAWERHRAYYRARGVAAWDDHEIPWRSTSNYAVARQYAQLVARLAPADGEVRLQEVGGGAGYFAGNFLRALSREPGGPALLERLRYLFSDFCEKTVREAAARAPLAEWVARGVAVPALCDALADAAPRRLDGHAAPAPNFVLAHYLACVLPTTYVERRGDAWGMLHARLGKNGALEFLPAPVTLDDELDAFHADSIRRYFAARGDGTAAWPLGLFDWLRRAQAQLAPGGLVLLSDFGVADHHRLSSDKLRPRLYGHSLNHPIEFAAIDHFAEEAGWGRERTTGATHALTHVMLGRGELPAAARGAFRELFVARSDGAELLDCTAAARALNQAGDHLRAARLLARAVALDPDDAALCLELGQTWLHAHEPARALEALTQGQALDLAGALDFDFFLGAAHQACGEGELALAALRRSLARKPDAATHLNLAVILHGRGEQAAAVRELDQALTLSPDFEPAARLRDEWASDWWRALRASAAC